MKNAMILFGLFVMSFPLSGTAQTVQVDIFHWGDVTTQPSLPGTEIRFHNLNAPEELKRQLPSFRGSQAQAEQSAMSWIQSVQGKAYTEQLRKSYDGHMLARQYQLIKAPAIVFEKGKYVV